MRTIKVLNRHTAPLHLPHTRAGAGVTLKPGEEVEVPIGYLDSLAENTAVRAWFDADLITFGRFLEPQAPMDLGPPLQTKVLEGILPLEVPAEPLPEVLASPVDVAANEEGPPDLIVPEPPEELPEVPTKKTKKEKKA